MLPTIHYKKLSLPESFTSIYRDKLTRACHLTVPTGDTHQVRVVKKKDGLWFKDGWEEFVRRHSIGYSYFMTFTLEGNSKFRVNLFDMTACEISYQSDEGGTSSPPLAEQKNSFVEVMDCDTDNDKMKSDEEPIEKDSDTSLVSECSKCAAMGLESNQKTARETSPARPYTEKGTEGVASKYPYWLMKTYIPEIEALEAAGIPIPAVNPFFAISIRDYQLKRGFVIIPRAFGSNHINCNSGDAAILKMSHGRKWNVRVRVINCGLDRTFGKGWLDFSRETRLEVGDVCLFELTNAEKLVFKVRIATPSS